jgi:excisionase family DNA binding protein
VSTHSKNTTADLTEWISLADAARMRGVSRQAMSKLVKNGRLRTLNAGGRQLVHKEDIAAFKALPPGRRARKTADD